LAGVLGVAVRVPDAKACGGCFHGPSQSGTVITDHRMIFRISPQQTTLYDEIEYSGNPASFAWVLPIHGPVTVGLSADIVFASLEAQTAPTIESPFLPSCPVCGCGGFGGSSGSSSGGSSSSGSSSGGVTVISQQQVGPYDTVQLSSTDPMALENWLTVNGYVIPADVQTIVGQYVSEGFDFLALRLAPGQGVQAMRPVRVTSPGAGLSLPLRMVAAGTGATVGLTLWVIGDGRYEAQNFANFTISPSNLVWDWSTNTSNYATLRAQDEMNRGNAAWQTESSLDLAPYQIVNPILADPADMDYLAVPASDAGADGGNGQSADEVRTADLDALFPGGVAANYSTVRITRMRGDLSHAALATDLVLQASADQSNISNVYQVTQSINAPACPSLPNPCPPCGGTSSSGSSGGTSSGNVGGIGGASGGSGGMFGTSGGNASGNTQRAPVVYAGGCSTSPSDTQATGAGIELFALGALGASYGRARRRRQRG
jgi:MYXO-CTERM domain-containing protein